MQIFQIGEYGICQIAYNDNKTNICLYRVDGATSMINALYMDS